MREEELRIGNLVAPIGSLVLTVCEIHEDCFCAKDVKGNSFKNTMDDLQPIPLTEELLIKCGFEKTEYNDYRHPVLIGTLTLYEGIAELHLSDMYSVWVNSLHHLQNLFYCLCGEELEVKL